MKNDTETEIKPVHGTVGLRDHVGNEIDATVVANPGKHPYLLLSASGLMSSIHMRPQDAVALGRLLITAGEAASWAPVNPSLLEAC